MIVRCYLALGNEKYVRGDWKTAASEYALVRDHERQFRALSRVADFDAIFRLLNSLPDKHPLLNEISLKVMAGGAHQKGVAAFLKLRDIGKAVEACAHLNQWDMVVNLYQSHQQLDEGEIMGRYAAHLAGNSHLSAALRVFQEFRLPREVAMLRDKEGEIAFRCSRKMIFAQKCFVFSATLLDQEPEAKAMAA
jgi:WD repeat-containing protein 35